MTGNENLADYRMRGHRVPEMSPHIISLVAQKLCEILKIDQKSFSPKKIGRLINKLEANAVNIDVIEDCEWLDCTRATVDPQTGWIYMPRKLFAELNRSKPEAIRIFLHELGHIFLCHKPLLHFADAQPKQTQDSEWQADEFADAVIRHLGLEREQLQLKFEDF